MVKMDKHIGAQYFTVRDHIQTLEDFDSTCRKIKDIGYKIIQISGTSLSAKDMRPIIDEHGLKVVTTHRSFDDFKNDIDEIIDYNKTLGCDLCGMGMMPKQYQADGRSVAEFIADANRVCETLKKENMYFGYHNHAYEFAKFGGKTVIDMLVNETDPDVFMFIADTYWIQVGGKNPADVIKELGSRAMAVHFKDFGVNKDNWTVPQMTEVGAGNLDWNGIIAACEAAGTCWALVEQDGCWSNGNPFDSLESSYKFLSSKGMC